MRKLTRICSFDIGERGSFQGAPLVYQGVLYTDDLYLGYLLSTPPHAKSAGAISTNPMRTWAAQQQGPRDCQWSAVSRDAGWTSPRVRRRNRRAVVGPTLVNAAVGEYLTAVPLVWKDMVFIGKAGGELGIRGQMMALGAADGNTYLAFLYDSGARRDGI